jgi:hypothetical protein
LVSNQLGFGAGRAMVRIQESGFHRQIGRAGDP